MPMQRKSRKSSCAAANKAFAAAAAAAAAVIIEAMTDTEQTLKFRADMASMVLDRSVGKARVTAEPPPDDELLVNVSVVGADGVSRSQADYRKFMLGEDTE